MSGKTPRTYSYTTLQEELKLHHGGGPKICEHQIEEGACFTCLEAERDALQARVEEAEARGVDFWHLVEEREAGWRYALECRQARIRELKALADRLVLASGNTG